MASYFINSGMAAVVIGGHDLAAKILMTFAVRFPWVIAAVSGDEKGQKAVLDKATNKHHHATQLNTAEYAPFFVATLLYLHSKGIAAPMASTLGAVGCVGYHLSRFITAKSIPGAPFAVLRYASMVMILLSIYETL